MLKSVTLLLCCFFFIESSIAGDILSANDQIRDGDTIVSARGEFELGFFSLGGGSTNRYLSIRYKAKASETIAWVDNREIPLTDASGILELSTDGALRVLNSTRDIIWSSKSSITIRNPVAQLLDTGNLVIRSESDPAGEENYLWQSFDFPDSTFLPGMKLGMNLATKTAWSLNSWKSKDDPSAGSYKVGLDINGYPQIIGRNDSAIYFRAGAWNGERFSAIPSQGPNSIYTYEYVFNEEEIYYKYEEIDRSVPTRIFLEPDGQVVRYTWTNRSNAWMQSIYFQSGVCGYYAPCGAFSTCNSNNPSRCNCLDNFKPKNLEAWRSLNFSEGCVLDTQFNCSARDSFHKVVDKTIPDTQNCTYDFRKNLKECEKMCLKDCSCTAYANTNSTGKGSGCLLWFGELIDMRDEESGQAFYVRIAPSGSGSSRGLIALIICLPVLLLLTVVLIGCYVWYVRKFRKQNDKGGTKLGDEALPYFEFTTIANATNNFSFNSKLGEGGFGPVYKGTLGDGEEIAVKRQSEGSTQGVEEFKNEVSCIAKLQHRNLVRLLGWSAEKGERMLIYEYMPNKSLDKFIFGVTVINIIWLVSLLLQYNLNMRANKPIWNLAAYKERALLDWPKRYNIIDGITRGLLYLHQDSRLRVIHRDLKASNILLDSDMNPKISDFGMARSFRGSETEANTARVVGTYGYMSPEYALEGAFSVKSDVYSFGVLVMEIVSGKRNRFFSHHEHNLNLLGHAWTFYNEGRLSELIDDSMLESSDQNEVFRVIQIGLLCVQQYPKDRPNMSSVLMMLTSKVSLPHPNQPGFFTERKLDEEFSTTIKHDTDSSSSITDTLSLPRS